MRTQPYLPHEDARLAALAEYDPQGGPADPTFGHIVELATRLFGVPTAFVSLIERDRQVFYAKVGLSLCETSREVAFCSHTIQQDEALVILDARLDPRFHDNPLVTGAPYIRFYAGVPLRSPGGHAVGTLCVADTRSRNSFTDADRRNLQDLGRLVLDTLELRRLDVARRASQSRFEHIAGTAPNGIICADHQGWITFWNSAAEKLFGHTTDEAIGASIDLIVPERMRGRHGGGLHRVAGGASPRLVGKTVELPACHKDGSEFPIELSLSMWQEDGHAAFGAIIRDIRERRANEDRLYRLAHLDPLTELPNRAVLHNRISELVPARSVSVLMLDLDGFKDVNDTLGHRAGDCVLQTVAKRLLDCVQRSDTVARLGGDEFVVLLPDTADPIRAAGVAECIIQSLAQPFLHDDQVVRLGVSVGIALAPLHGDTADELLSCADMALYQAKADGRRCQRLFTPALRAVAQAEVTCREELHRAVERGEFVLFYQPQVRLSDRALVGAEALIRWQHPERGLIAPGAFLPTLDRSRYAATVGNWVLRSACEQAAAWRRSGAPAFRMGVNLCAAQFQSGDLAETVRQVLTATGLPPSGLELEITENIILNQSADLLEALNDLHQQGVSLAFDDYGTGYASLSLLKRFPLTRLKIDRSFVTDMLDSHEDATIVRAILQLGHGFRLQVIAEGIETETVYARLRAKGCQEGQGYLFGKPMPAAEFAARFGLAAVPVPEAMTAA